MIDAGQVLGVAAVLQAHQGALMGAAVDHGVKSAVLVAGDDDRYLADRGGLVVARIRDVDVETKIVPDRPPEDAFLLELVNLLIRKQPERHARDPFFGPAEGFAQIVRCRQYHGRLPIGSYALRRIWQPILGQQTAVF